jgi:hypothetical protein
LAFAGQYCAKLISAPRLATQPKSAQTRRDRKQARRLGMRASAAWDPNVLDITAMDKIHR